MQIFEYSIVKASFFQTAVLPRRFEATQFYDTIHCHDNKTSPRPSRRLLKLQVKSCAC